MPMDLWQGTACFHVRGQSIQTPAWKQAVPCQRSIGMHTVSSHHNPQQEQRNQRTENARRFNTKYIVQTYSLKYMTTYNIQLQ